MSVTDILTKLAAIALLRHRDVNAHFADDELRIFPNAHIGLAVATERGLIVPVQREVERKSLVQIAAERKEIVQRTREGKLSQEDLDGGTFTISNLGMYGVEIFTAVLNPPQAAILAVGAIEEKPVVDERRLRRAPADGDDPDLRPPGRRRREGRRVPPRAEDAARGARPGALTRIWYRVTDLDAARAFYTGKLGFTETAADEDWAELERGGMKIALAEGEPFLDGPVASIDVVDVMAEADHLRDEQVEIGTVLELHERGAHRRRLRPRREPPPARRAAPQARRRSRCRRVARRAASTRPGGGSP